LYHCIDFQYRETEHDQQKYQTKTAHSKTSIYQSIN
jgi:hypothetical protein